MTSPSRSDISVFTRLHVERRDDLQALREAGLRQFEAAGLPQATDEEWRFTNTEALAEIKWELPETTLPVDSLIATHAISDAIQIVLLNGQLLPLKGSLPRGLFVGSLSDAPTDIAERVRSLMGSAATLESSPFTALNAALLEDVVVIHAAPGVVVDRSIHLMSLATSNGSPLLFCPRVIVVAEEDSIVRFVETHAGNAADAILSNTVVELFIGDRTVVDHYQTQWNAENTHAIQSTVAVLQAAATYTHHHASQSGKFIRNDLQAVLNGERADATLNGMVLVDGQRLTDNHTLIRHEKPNCTSHELYKHVVADESRCVFKGKIFVQKDAQHTDSKQTSRTLLLSDRATMDAMPALEIYADDVKCTHGSTIGPLDEQMQFYLRSRGLSSDAARHLLIYAFAADMTARMKARSVRTQIERYLAAKQDLPQDLSIEAT